MVKPELLAPAGDLEKLKVAVTYGADAIYFGSSKLSLRSMAKNFDLAQMTEGVEFAHKAGVKAYVTLNIFARDEDFYGLEEYLYTLRNIGVDALIISDPGIFMIAREKVPQIDIHISTQANNTNFRSAMFWHKQGAKRVVVSRELSISDIKYMYRNLPKEMQIEAFVHGAMCISYSGRCYLSSFLTNRDSNRGECSQPCRWEYTIAEAKKPNDIYSVTEDEKGAYILNAKDLCMIEYLPELINAGVSSFKIEGRMKSSFYVATVVKAYREAIDHYFLDHWLYQQNQSCYVDETMKVSHRDYCTGFYFGYGKDNMQVYSSSSYVNKYDFVAMALEYDPDEELATVEQRNKFEVGETLEVLRPKAENVYIKIEEMYDENDNPIQSAPHPQQIVKIRTLIRLNKYDMIRREKDKK